VKPLQVAELVARLKELASANALGRLGVA